MRFSSSESPYERANVHYSSTVMADKLNENKVWTTHSHRKHSELDKTPITIRSERYVCGSVYSGKRSQRNLLMSCSAT